MENHKPWKTRIESQSRNRERPNRNSPGDPPDPLSLPRPWPPCATITADRTPYNSGGAKFFSNAGEEPAERGRAQ